MSPFRMVEVPQDLRLSESDNLDKVYEQYKDKPVKKWNVRDEGCRIASSTGVQKGQGGLRTKSMDFPSSPSYPENKHTRSSL